MFHYDSLQTLRSVMAGHSALKTRVNALMSPAIHDLLAAREDVDARPKRRA